ncbi:MAG: hypothetical protein JWL83_3262 [Actinomycetia bacterium]|nr:hypothetical protein [Actinomycetes bacterium]
MTVMERVVTRVSRRLERGDTRRSFLVKTAIVGSALATRPLRFLLRPGTAYAAMCGPAADCNSGWTVFCCSINSGQNACPPGTIPAGWWKADNSGFCQGGPRYYVDCNATCGSCGCGSSGICAPNCTSCQCHCGTGTCDERRVCCNEFRYGQCHQEVPCVGPVVCRVVTCVAPWVWDPSCTTTSATANQTALHTAPCLDTNASVFGFGTAASRGSPASLRAPITAMEATPDGRGYWLVGTDGGIFAFGNAPYLGSTGNLVLRQPVVDMASTPKADGYWLVASDGGVFAFGKARFDGAIAPFAMAAPAVGIAATPTGRGYWVAAADGGVFGFGDAHFHGSLGNVRLTQPIVGIAATPTGKGYWMAAADGGVFCFGDAHFHGSLVTDPNPRGPAVDIEGRNDGYWIATT